MKPAYTPNHPRWYRERLPIFWWLGRVSYMKFIARELTSIAVGYTALLLVVLVWVLGRGEEAYRRFLGALASTPVVVLHVFILGGLLFHTLTWLHLAPKAMVVRLGGRKVSDGAVLAGHYAAWAVASGVVLWWLAGGRG